MYCGLDPVTFSKQPRERDESPTHKCVNCGSSSDLVLDPQLFEHICQNCGCVVRQHCYFDEAFPERAVQKHYDGPGYLRKFYLNEVLKQWRGEEPPMPDDLYKIFKQAYRKARATDRKFWARRNLCREKIHALCRSISLDQIDCSSVPGLSWTKLKVATAFEHRAKTGTILKDFRKFGEKWRSLLCRLSKRPAARPPPALCNYISEFYQKAEANFDRVRHSANCDGRANCHKDKQLRCRNSMLCINYVVKKAILSFCQGDKLHPIYLRYKGDWPNVSKERRHQIKRRYWIPICRLAMGGFRFWVKD